MRWPMVMVVLLVASLANAQSKADRRLAKQYYKLGAELYQRSDYKAALEQFEKAYGYAKLPDLVFNMARCNELLNRHEKAIALYQEFLVLAGNKAPRKDIEARITTLEKKLRTQRQKQAVESQRETAEQERRRQLEAELAARRQREAEQQAHARRKGPAWPGWTMVGTGGALLAAGVIFGAAAKGLASDVDTAWNNATHWHDVEDDYSSGETMQTLQVASLIAGGISLLAGASWLVIRKLRGGRPETPRASSTALMPALLPGGAYLSAKVTF